jgi:hypothetical protein
MAETLSVYMPGRWCFERHGHKRAKKGREPGDRSRPLMPGSPLALRDSRFSELGSRFLGDLVHREDQQQFGEQRTKRLILEIYDALAEATQTGKPYQTRLDPPPADARVVHPPRVAAALAPQQRLLAEATSFILLFLHKRRKPRTFSPVRPRHDALATPQMVT